MSEFKELLNEQLKDETFRKVWHDIQPEIADIRTTIQSSNISEYDSKETA